MAENNTTTERNHWGAITSPMPPKVQRFIARWKKNKNFGIEGEYGKRWHAMNYDIYAYQETPVKVIVQIRNTTGKPGRWTNVKKEYRLLFYQHGKLKHRIVSGLVIHSAVRRGVDPIEAIDKWWKKKCQIVPTPTAQCDQP